MKSLGGKLIDSANTVIIGSAGALVSVNTENFCAIFGGNFDLTEADVSITAPHSGRVKLIRSKSTVNSISVAFTTQLRVNGVSMGVGSIITASTVEQVDSPKTETVEFSKGDIINFISSSPAGSGSSAFHFLAELEYDND
jgi:hypothetical protein